jgi:ribosomal protein S27E
MAKDFIKFSIKRHRTERRALAQGMLVVGRDYKTSSSLVKMPCCGHEQLVYNQTLNLQRAVRCKSCGTRAPAPNWSNLPPPVDPQDLLSANAKALPVPAHVMPHDTLPRFGFSYLTHVPSRDEYAAVKRHICGCELIIDVQHPSSIEAAANCCPQCGDTNTSREAYEANPPTPASIGRPKAQKPKQQLAQQVQGLQDTVNKLVHGFIALIVINNLQEPPMNTDEENA